MDVLFHYWYQLQQSLESFRGDPVVAFMKEHTDIPVLFVTAYLALVFYGKDWMKEREPFRMRWLFTLWNLLLSLFSIAGAISMVPHLVRTLTTHTLYFTICSEPRVWYFDGVTGFWTAAFILSKIPELIDTVFLVFQKKPVIFLHWYHHTTVMLYCWHSYTNTIGAGMWFATMNYLVHSIMYTYYFMMNLSGLTRSLVKPFAKLITTLQLLQMIVGMSVTVLAAYWRWVHPEGCFNDPSNSRMGLLMYTSYFLLFAALFKKLYLTKSGGGGGGKSQPHNRNGGDSVCDSATEAMSNLHDGSKKKHQ